MNQTKLIAKMETAHLNKFTLAYIECALWSSMDESTPEGGNPMDQNYSKQDLSQACLNSIMDDCEAFQQANLEDLEEMDDAQAGHDFWLTRNGHGAGFWDRGLGELGERLTKSCKTFKEVSLYVGDDGKIYCQ